MKFKKVVLLLYLTFTILGCEQPVKNNQILIDLVEADQKVRSTSQLDLSSDMERIKQVELIESNGELSTSVDYYNAAIIFQHGRSSSHYLKAHKLSKKAFSMDPTLAKAKWLSCASADRYLLSIGKAQIWGTQFILNGNGEKVLQQPYRPLKKSDKKIAACFIN